MEYPLKIQELVELFETFSPEQKRENLVLYADNAKNYAPKEELQYDIEDIRKDEECLDTIGVFLKVEEGQKVQFRLTLGPEVQTLTRAMASILCEGFEGATVDQVITMPQDFIPKIVGGELVRLRSQTVYYVLSRMKAVCKAYKNKKRKVLN